MVGMESKGSKAGGEISGFRYTKFRIAPGLEMVGNVCIMRFA